MDINFMIALPLFHVGHSLYVGLIHVEMYNMTVIENRIEFSSYVYISFISDGHSVYVGYSGLCSRSVRTHGIGKIFC